MKCTKLKGGSLSSTSLYEDDNTEFIRKEIQTKVNREYGFIRWYSQLKKLQELQDTGLFPKILGVGTTKSTAYFDLEYLKNYSDVKTLLSDKVLTDNQIEEINNAIWRAFKQLHSNKFIPNKGAPKLYFKEEIEQKINDACMYENFHKFHTKGVLGSYEYNGLIVHGLNNYLNELENYFSELNLTSEETIHGNPTLENIMYSFDENKVIFIDPYEESIIDSKLLDYSQVLQCSRSLYGYINDRKVDVKYYTVSYSSPIPKNFKVFNDMFEKRLAIECTAKEIQTINILEATQFIRMLPFKCAAGEFDKAKYFYLHACHLLNKVFG
jgi:hypothetical protein